MPTNESGQVLACVLAFGGGEEAGVAGIPGRLGERLDGRVGERFRVQVSRADVLGVQQVPSLSDEIEVGSVGRLLDNLAPGQRTDALEARARREDGDDEDTAPMTTAALRSRRRTALRDGVGFGCGPSGGVGSTGPTVRWRQSGRQVRHVDGWIVRVGGHRSGPSEAARLAWSVSARLLPRALTPASSPVEVAMP